MLRLWLNISTRWFIIFAFTFFCSLSGLVSAASGDQLFLRNNINAYQKTGSVKGTASESASYSFVVSQVQEIKIEAQKYTPQAPAKPKTWGKSTQIDETTWTIDVGQDERSATASEILSALNSYRQKHGRGALAWDNKLGGFAQSRAEHFTSTGKLDAHAGFKDYINNQDGFNKLGFMTVGENSSYGYTLEGTHLIEWVYAGDKPHDDNQLDSKWTHVGIGVSGTATDLVFGGKKM